MSPVQIELGRAWLNWSVRIDLTTAISSITSGRCVQSWKPDTGLTVLRERERRSEHIGNTRDKGKPFALKEFLWTRFARYRRRAGLSSNRSSWLGKPAMCR